VTKTALDTVPLPVTEGLESISDARIDFVGLNVEVSAAAAEFIITLAHPLSTLDCLSFPMASGPGSTSNLLSLSFHKSDDRGAIGGFDLAPGGVVRVRDFSEEGGKVTYDEELSRGLSWTEDSEGRLHLVVPWALIPIEGKKPVVVSIDTYRIQVSKLLADTWESLNQRYGGSFKLDAPEGELAVRDGHLVRGEAPVEGVLGHLPELCRRGTRQESWDFIPGPSHPTHLQAIQAHQGVVIQQP
jgi:hypothetical protein